MPAWRAIAAAVCWLSPVIITTPTPRRRRAATAATESSFIVSATPITPASLPSTMAAIGVLPSVDSRRAGSAKPSTPTPASSMNLSLPTRTCRPSMMARTPFPVTDSKSVALTNSTPRALAPATMAAPRGCSDVCSAEATSRSRSSSVRSPLTIRSVRAGVPCVIVPVLSNTIVSIFCAVSSASAERMRMPCSAPLPVLTMIANGGARAGDDQHGYRADERKRERRRRTGHEPDHESCDRDAHNHWNEVARDHISESLDRRFRTLSLFDQPDDLSEHRVLADSAGPEPEGAGLVDGCPDHGVTDLLGGRYRFTGDHRLIDS